jgi:protein-disulfide isomerase
MTRSILLAGTAAALAIAGCDKKQESQTATADTQSVTITQASPPPGGTWADVTNETAAGAVMGNPNAAVKLIEIGSLSCPHCKKFSEEGIPPLIENYVKSGKVSWEYRPYVIHGAIDMVYNLAVRCNGVKTFFPMVEGLYKDQDTLMAKIQAVPQDQIEKVQNLPPNQVFGEMAKLVGLQDWAAARGIPAAKLDQCFANQAMIDKEVQLTSDVSTQFPDFVGTPTFVINGTMEPSDVTNWAKLEPHLKDAIK